LIFFYLELPEPFWISDLKNPKAIKVYNMEWLKKRNKNLGISYKNNEDGLD
jgi:hypothetical protein